MQKEMTKEIRDILEHLTSPIESSHDIKEISTTMDSSAIRIRAIQYLRTKECLVETNSHSYIITAWGWDYLEEITTWGPKYWFKNNWFPALVAATTIAVGITSIATTILV